MNTMQSRERIATMKKRYVEPQMEAVGIKMGQQLLVSSITGNTGLTPGGGGDGTGGATPQAPGLFGEPAWDVLLGD